MIYIFGFCLFLLGTAIGSFLNVIADRYNTGLSYLRGRSFCFSCNVQLQSRDLLPIFSFLFLKGRCRNCESKIGASSFWIEVMMGALTLLAASQAQIFNFQFSIFNFLEFLLLTAIFGVILLISIYDLRHFIIPDSFLVVLGVLALVYHLAFGFSFYYLLATVVLSLPFLLLFVISKGTWLGFGDVKYMFVIGLFLGVSQGVSAVLLAFWIGAGFALTALSLKFLKSHIRLPIALKDLTIKSEIPFGPFLSIGIIISFYFNVDLFQIHSFFPIL